MVTGWVSEAWPLDGWNSEAWLLGGSLHVFLRDGQRMGHCHWVGLRDMAAGWVTGWVSEAWPLIGFKRYGRWMGYRGITPQPHRVKSCNSKHLVLYNSSYWFTHCVNIERECDFLICKALL